MKPKKQEQEEARREVTEIAPNVLRMELPILMPGLRHVNCYALLDDEGAAVVDPGLPGPDTWAALKDRLSQAGLSETDVHTVVITHSHPDHFGCAKRFAKAAGARIVAYESFGWGTPADADTHDHDEVSVDDRRAGADALEADTDRRGDEPSSSPSASRVRAMRAGHTRPSPWGGSPLGFPKRDPSASNVAELMMSEDFFPDITDPVGHLDVLRLAGRDWFVHFTPGHTQDHLCLHSPELGIFLSGDHVLPTITPHIGGFGHTPDPLRSFIESLNAVAGLQDVSTILPAHGHPFADLAGRTEAIKRHHEERLQRIKQIGRELGRANVVEFSQTLFPERSWGMMAESETYAHLEHLRLAREAESYSEDGKLIYVIR
ncbi:MAG: MBL fold metallo-hydrolase [Deltaproteobacteria bacterium]|nr:MBL fold metallo-hydrolase [Deltaproteobacteria bacterium]